MDKYVCINIVRFFLNYIIKRKPASLMLLFWLDAQEAITWLNRLHISLSEHFNPPLYIFNLPPTWLFEKIVP